jgi:hypothetical protein
MSGKPVPVVVLRLGRDQRAFPGSGLPQAGAGSGRGCFEMLEVFE